MAGAYPAWSRHRRVDLGTRRPHSCRRAGNQPEARMGRLIETFRGMVYPWQCDHQGPSTPCTTSACSTRRSGTTSRRWASRGPISTLTTGASPTSRTPSNTRPRCRSAPASSSKAACCGSARRRSRRATPCATPRPRGGGDLGEGHGLPRPCGAPLGRHPRRHARRRPGVHRRARGLSAPPGRAHDSRCDAGAPVIL